MRLLEYRIFMPFKMEWCRAAAKYAVNKRTQHETGGGDGFEIIDDGIFEEDGVTGRWVKRMLHFKNQVPAAVRWAIPNKFSSILEENKNAFPHYVATFRMESMGENLIMDTETRHFTYKPGMEIPENAMGFSEDELAIREVMYLDILDGKKPKRKEFDIHGFSHPEIGIPEFPKEHGHHDPSAIPSWVAGWTGPLTLIVKTVKFHLKWKGIQGFVEKYVTKTIWPQTYTDTHRAMIVWIDSWFRMSEEDLKALEDSTRDALAGGEFDE